MKKSVVLAVALFVSSSGFAMTLSDIAALSRYNIDPSQLIGDVYCAETGLCPYYGDRSLEDARSVASRLAKVLNAKVLTAEDNLRLEKAIATANARNNVR